MSTNSLFKNLFMPKKAPARKTNTFSQLQMDAAERAREFDLDYKSAHMLLGAQHFRFDTQNGEWFDGTYCFFFRSLKPNINTIYLAISFKDGTGEYTYPNNGQRSKRQDVHLNRSNSKEVQRMQKSNQQLHEENNLLKVKNEILIDMMSEICSEYKFEMKQKNTK
jgi:hypothetical protein